MPKSDPSLGRICQINTNYWFNQLDTTETGYSVKLDLKQELVQAIGSTNWIQPKPNNWDSMKLDFQQRINTNYWFNQLDTTKTKQLRLGTVWN